MAPYRSGSHSSSPQKDLSFAEWAQLSDSDVRVLVELSKPVPGTSVPPAGAVLPLQPNTLEPDKFYVEPARMVDAWWARCFVSRDQAVREAVEASDKEEEAEAQAIELAREQGRAAREKLRAEHSRRTGIYYKIAPIMAAAEAGLLRSRRAAHAYNGSSSGGGSSGDDAAQEEEVDIYDALFAALSEDSNLSEKGGDLPLLHRLHVGVNPRPAAATTGAGAGGGIDDDVASPPAEYYIRAEWDAWVAACRSTRTTSLQELASQVGLYGEPALRALWAECGALPALPPNETRVSWQLARAAKAELLAALVPLLSAPGVAEMAARWDAKDTGLDGSQSGLVQAADFVREMNAPGQGIRVYHMKSPAPPTLQAAGSADTDPAPLPAAAVAARAADPPAQAPDDDEPQAAAAAAAQAAHPQNAREYLAQFCISLQALMRPQELIAKPL